MRSLHLACELAGWPVHGVRKEADKDEAWSVPRPSWRNHKQTGNGTNKDKSGSREKCGEDLEISR